MACQINSILFHVFGEKQLPQALHYFSIDARIIIAHKIYKGEYNT